MKHPKRDWKNNLLSFSSNCTFARSIPKGIERVPVVPGGVNVFKKHPKRDWKWNAGLSISLRIGTEASQKGLKAFLILNAIVKTTPRSIPKGIESYFTSYYFKLNSMKHPKRDWKILSQHFFVFSFSYEASQKGLKVVLTHTSCLRYQHLWSIPKGIESSIQRKRSRVGVSQEASQKGLKGLC